MDVLLFISFLTATFLIVVTPGPSVALASSWAVRFGSRTAAVTVAGRSSIEEISGCGLLDVGILPLFKGNKELPS